MKFYRLNQNYELLRRHLRYQPRLNCIATVVSYRRTSGGPINVSPIAGTPRVRGGHVACSHFTYWAELTGKHVKSKLTRRGYELSARLI